VLAGFHNRNDESCEIVFELVKVENLIRQEDPLDTFNVNKFSIPDAKPNLDNRGSSTGRVYTEGHGCRRLCEYG